MQLWFRFNKNGIKMNQPKHNGPIVGANNGIVVIDCVNCGYAHVTPLPDKDEVEQQYVQDKLYDEKRIIEWFEKERQEHSMGYWDAEYEYECRLLNKRLSILDVGAGSGEFVSWVNRCRFEDIGYKRVAYGIEPSTLSRKYAVWKLYYSSNDFLRAMRGALIDLNVRMSLVLEHIVNPAEFVRHYMSLLGKTGRILIKVPWDNSPIQQRIGTQHYIAQEHINYWNPVSLRKLLEKEGLRVVHTSTTAPLELNVLLGRNYIGNDILGKKVHTERLHIEKFAGWRIFQLYFLLYRTLHIGREIIMVAEK